MLQSLATAATFAHHVFKSRATSQAHHIKVVEKRMAQHDLDMRSMGEQLALVPDQPTTRRLD